MVVDARIIPPFSRICQHGRVGVGLKFAQRWGAQVGSGSGRGRDLERAPHKKTPALGAGVSCSSSAQLGETAAELAGR